MVSQVAASRVHGAGDSSKHHHGRLATPPPHLLQRRGHFSPHDLLRPSLHGPGHWAHGAKHRPHGAKQHTQSGQQGRLLYADRTGKMLEMSRKVPHT